MNLKIKPIDFARRMGKIYTSFNWDDMDDYSKGAWNGFNNIVLSQDIKLIEIDKDLIPLIESTDNSFFYRPLFFDTLFINTDFTFKDYLIKGIAVQSSKKSNDWIFIAIIIHNNKNHLPGLFGGCLIDASNGTIEENDEAGIGNYIRRILCNIVDFVTSNQNDLILKVVKPSDNHNFKRISKNKIPLQEKIIIKPRSHLKHYLVQFNKDSETKSTHKFLVRGHWRRFRNKRYSELKRHNPIWIKPYYKGEGILINKSYLIKDV